MRLTFPNQISPAASDQLETPERGYGIRAVVGLEDPREENMRFLAPSAYEFLKVRKALEYGMYTGGSDELANAPILRTSFESGTE